MRINLKLLTSSSLILLLLVLAVQTVAAQSNSKVGFTLTPNQESVSTGETLQLNIEINTGVEKVNSFMTKLTYPQDKLIFESINTEGSPFNMALEAKGGEGEVSIIRGTTTAVAGEAPIGKVTFKATSPVSAKEIILSNDSAIVSSDNKNILPGSTITESTSSNGNETQQTASSEPTSQPNFFTKIINSITNFFSSLFK